MVCEQYKGRMISPQGLAKELAVSEFTIHRWIRQQKIQAVKLSSRCTRETDIGRHGWKEADLSACSLKWGLISICDGWYGPYKKIVRRSSKATAPVMLFVS